MTKLQFLYSFIFILGACSQKEKLFQAEDFTEENIFSENIEGPAFDKNGNLFVVNYGKDGTIGLVNPNGESTLFLTLPEGSTANSIKFNEQGNMLLADFIGHNILKVNTQTKKVDVFVHHPNFNQPNDLCINSKGQLFASDPNWKSGTGNLWRIDPDGNVILLDSAMGTTNGIELSPDEKTMYVNESAQRKIWKFNVDESGNITNKILLTEFSDFGLDGMKCDAKGNLYITRYGKGTILVISPEGDFIREIPLKGKNCSNLVFGGENGKTIFVTMQDRKGLEKFYNDVAGKGY